VHALAGPLNTLLDALVQALPSELPLARTAYDPAQLKTVCRQLDALLAYDDAAAADLLSEHADLFSSAFPQHYRLLESAVKQFDFETALVHLRAAVTTLPT